MVIQYGRARAVESGARSPGDAARLEESRTRSAHSWRARPAAVGRPIDASQEVGSREFIAQRTRMAVFGEKVEGVHGLSTGLECVE